MIQQFTYYFLSIFSLFTLIIIILSVSISTLVLCDEVNNPLLCILYFIICGTVISTAISVFSVLIVNHYIF